MCFVLDWSFLTIIGALTLFYYILNITWKIYRNWKLFFAPTYPDFSKYGKWSGMLRSSHLQVA